MLVLKILGFGLIGLLGLCALLLVLALLGACLRVGVQLRGKDDEPLILVLRLGLLRLRLLPRTKKEEPPQKTAKKKSPKKEKEKPPRDKKSKHELTAENLDIGEILCLSLDLLTQMKDQLRIDILEVDVMLGTGRGENRHATRSHRCDFRYDITILEQHFKVKQLHIAVDGDFEADNTKWQGTFACSVRPMLFFVVLLRNQRRLRAVYRSLWKKKENAI